MQDLDVQSLLESWSGQRLVLEHEPRTGSWIILAVHAVRNGRYDGGTRMRRYAGLADGVRDAMRLAEGMSLKWAVHGIPVGGAKAVLALAGDNADEQRTVLRAYGALVASLRGGLTTGGDIGVGPAQLDVVADAVDGPWVYGSAASPIGWGDSSITTAIGLMSSMEATVARLGLPDGLQGARVAVQGAGKVGRLLIDSLLKAGAEVVAADVDAEAVDWLQEKGVPVADPDKVLLSDCDVLAPCAAGGVLNATTIPGLRCQAVVGAANNQLATRNDAALLERHDVLYAPDFVVNGGGAIADLGMDELGWTSSEAVEHVQAIGQTLDEIYREAAASNLTTLDAAFARAGRSLEDA